MSLENVSCRNGLFTQICPELEEDERSFSELVVTRPDTAPYIVQRYRRTIQMLIRGSEGASGYPDVREQMLERAERVTNVLARFCMLPKREQRLLAVWTAGQAGPPFREQIVQLEVHPGRGVTVCVEASEDLFDGESVFNYQGLGYLNIWGWELDVDYDEYFAVSDAAMEERWTEIMLPAFPHTANMDMEVWGD